MLCSYNCGLEAKYQLKNGKYCCSKSHNSCPINKIKNSKGCLSGTRVNRNYKEIYKNISVESKNKMKWNKNLTKETDIRIKNSVDKAEKSRLEGKWTPYYLGKHLSDNHKDKIIKGMHNSDKNIINSKGFYRFYKKGIKYGINCDSRLELAFVIYHIEHNHLLIRNKEGFNYTYLNNIHRYYPDFILNGKFIEIKGMKSELNDIKLQSVINSGKDISILYKNDLKYCFDYIYEKYNVRYNKLELLYDNI